MLPLRANFPTDQCVIVAGWWTLSSKRQQGVVPRRHKDLGPGTDTLPSTTRDSSVLVDEFWLLRSFWE